MNKDEPKGLKTWLIDKDLLDTARLVTVGIIVRIFNFVLYVLFGQSEINFYLDIIFGLCLLGAILTFPMLRKEWDSGHYRKKRK